MSDNFDRLAESKIENSVTDHALKRLMHEVNDSRLKYGNFNVETDPVGGQMIQGKIAGTELTVMSNSRDPEPALLIVDKDGDVLARFESGVLSFSTDDHKSIGVKPGGKRTISQLLWK